MKSENVIFEPKTQAQLDVLNNKAPNLLHDGPWFCGKTHVGAAKGLALGMRYHNNCIAFVRKKRVDLKATLWKWFIDKVLPPKWAVASNDTELYRRLENGTEFYGVGLDSTNDVNKLASREYGLIVVEEAKEITEDDFDEKLSRCLRLPGVPFRQMLCLTNPGAPSHFLNRRFIKDRMPGYERIKAQILPFISKDYKQRMDQLTGIFKLRYKDGLWAAFEGLVYPFDADKHIIEPFIIPKDWKRYLGVDFGFDHPFVAQWWAVSPDDRWYMYREIYHTRRTVNTHAPDILHFCELDGMKPEAICDHDAEDRATLEEHGIQTIPAKKERMAGQGRVYDKFEQNRIFFFKDATIERDMRQVMEKKPASTVEEFDSYVFTNKAKEDMVKVLDDGMDTMRYVIYTILGGPILEVHSMSTHKSFAELGVA